MPTSSFTPEVPIPRSYNYLSGDISISMILKKMLLNPQDPPHHNPFLNPEPPLLCPVQNVPLSLNFSLLLLLLSCIESSERLYKKG